MMNEHARLTNPGLEREARKQHRKDRAYTFMQVCQSPGNNPGEYRISVGAHDDDEVDAQELIQAVELFMRLTGLRPLSIDDDWRAFAVQTQGRGLIWFKAPNVIKCIACGKVIEHVPGKERLPDDAKVYCSTDCMDVSEPWPLDPIE